MTPKYTLYLLLISFTLTYLVVSAGQALIYGWNEITWIPNLIWSLVATVFLGIIIAKPR